MNEEQEIKELKKTVQFTLDNVEKSKVEDFSTKEDFVYYTEDVEEWRKFLDNDNIKQTCKELNQEVVFDEEIIKNATGFALGPVARYNKKMCEVITQTTNSLEELKEFLKDKKYILYLILHKIVRFHFDKNTFKYKILEVPEEHYIFRGCFLDEE
jgi:hypothetical protein